MKYCALVFLYSYYVYCSHYAPTYFGKFLCKYTWKATWQKPDSAGESDDHKVALKHCCPPVTLHLNYCVLCQSHSAHISAWFKARYTSVIVRFELCVLYLEASIFCCSRRCWASQFALSSSNTRLFSSSSLCWASRFFFICSWRRWSCRETNGTVRRTSGQRHVNHRAQYDSFTHTESPKSTVEIMTAQFKV